MALARTSTHVGKPIRKPRVHKFMAKTTRKGAYKKNRKANFQKRRAPFVETKQQTDIMVALKAAVPPGGADDTLRYTTEPKSLSNGTVSNPLEYNILPIQAFLNMNKGLDTSDMIGSSVYGRYLKTKLEFELPGGSNPIRHPCDVYVIHGFVTAPLNLSLHTTPEAQMLERSGVNAHIDKYVQEYFNQRLDKLQFIPKRTSNLKILGYRRLRVKRDNQLGVDPTAAPGTMATSYAGSQPLINMTCNFPIKRKIHYVQGSSNNSLEFNYPNYAWLPFVLVYNPTAGDFLDTQQYATEPKIKVRYNSAFYYSDS